MSPRSHTVLRGIRIKLGAPAPRLCRYTRENHNSVLGVREYALQSGGRFQAVEEEWVEDWLSGHKESDHFLHPRDGSPETPTFSLFAFPAEENFSGVKYPLRWIREIQVCPRRVL